MKPVLSTRAATIAPSPIRKLVPFAEAAIKRGTHVYHLNIGQPDIETPEAMLDSLKNFPKKIIHYCHSQGDDRYLESLVSYYKKNNIELEKWMINVTTGGSEAIVFAFMTAMDHGDEVIIPEPFYTNYNGFAIMAGVKIAPVTTYGDNGFHLPPMEAIEKKINSKTKAILLCNPNNPTGTVYTRKEIEGICELCKKHNLWLLTDEAYREFVYDSKEHISGLSLSGMEDRVIMMDSISKRYSACGARIGCIVSRNKALMDAVLKLGQARLCSPLVDQMLATAAENLPEDYMEETVEEYRSRRDVVFEGLEKIPGVIALKPSGAFYNIVKLPVDSAEKFALWLLTDFEENGETVMLAPAEGFYATKDLGQQEARIAYVLCKEDLKKALILLKIAIERYNGR
jgi:aspartate aminotransferase